MGLAGLDSPEDLDTMKAGIAMMKLPPRKGSDLVVNDWRTALAGAFTDGPGVTLIAGTGCVAAAQSEGGKKVARVGGWGHIVDDRGSAYDIGREALYAAMRAYDGRGPETELLDFLMRRLKVDEPQGIIARVYAGHMSVTQLASLSALVAEAASLGDKVALKILEEKGRILGELVVSAASQLGMLGTRFGVSLNGGVFRAGSPVLTPLEKTIHASAPRAILVEPKLPPACGAVVLLLRRDGRLSEQVISTMTASLQAAAPSKG